MDQARDIRNDAKDQRRARIEKARWDEDRRKERETKEEKDARRKEIHLEHLRKAKVDAMHRATAKREIARLNAVREKRINEITEARMWKFREKQYLEQAKAALEPAFNMDEEEVAAPTEDLHLSRAEKKEQSEF